MEEIVKHINDTNASYRRLTAGDAKNTDLFLDNEHYELFRDSGEYVTVRFNKTNLAQAILFIASILPRKFDQGQIHKVIKYSDDFILDQLEILNEVFKVDGKASETFTQEWTARINVPKKNGEIDNRFYFNGLLKDVEYINNKGEHCKVKFTIRNYLAGGYSNLHIKKAEDGIFDISIVNSTTPYDDKKEEGVEELYVFNDQDDQKESLQQILYGAPGTSKSFTIKNKLKGKDVIRTTFHPDSDYSTFVGAYKPTTKQIPIYSTYGEKAVLVKDENGDIMTEDSIVYEFVEQSFLQAYINSWKTLPEEKPQYLVIEEINRGNCAQIFGDLFQLLDRNDEGFSEYPINADSDMKKQLNKAFHGLEIPQKNSINEMFEGRDVVKGVLDGDLLLLPNNLYIWATMNTSDQSLFPIDSAFKRRWDWKYVPISDAGKDWMINVNGNKYDWWDFLEKINNLIGSTTNSEDKKLGYFFCKADTNNEISAETFVGKVIFYLWNDVFKDYDYPGDLFKDKDGNKLTYDKFYTTDGEESKVIEDNVELFLNNLTVKMVSASDSNKNNEVPNSVVIKVNDNQVKSINAIPYTTIQEYVKLHPEMSAQDVINVWEPYKRYSNNSWIVCDEEKHNTLPPRYANYSYEIKCNDGNSLWVNKDGWMHNPSKPGCDNIKDFMDAVNSAKMGITITEHQI